MVLRMLELEFVKADKTKRVQIRYFMLLFNEGVELMVYRKGNLKVYRVYIIINRSKFEWKKLTVYILCNMSNTTLHFIRKLR